jgi:hypothetical protein
MIVRPDSQLAQSRSERLQEPNSTLPMVGEMVRKAVAAWLQQNKTRMKKEKREASELVDGSVRCWRTLNLS